MLISYAGVDIYERDLILFTGNNWLNDVCINFCLKHIEENVLPRDLRHCTLLLDCIIVSFLMIQCEEDDEFQNLREGVTVASREWIISPLTNSDSFSNVSSHWSVLILHVNTRKFWHYDSMNQSNIFAARVLARKLCRLVYNIEMTGADEDINIEIFPGSRQYNGYDCGVYSVLCIRHVCDLINSHRESAHRIIATPDAEFIISQNEVDSYRMQQFEEISQLARTKGGLSEMYTPSSSLL